MMKAVRAMTVLALAGGLPVSAAAQAGWSFDASIYLFAAETTNSMDTGTPIGEVETTLSFKDALENLDLAAMAAIEARNGRWGLLLDYMLTDITLDGDTPGPLFSGAEVGVRTQIVTGMAFYRVQETPDLSFDLGGGARWYSTDTKLKLKPGTAAGQTIDFDDDWADPVIGARLRYQFADRWGSTVAADYGGFRADSETWQVLLTLDYAISERWLIRGGYRYLDFDHEIDGKDYSFTQQGPILGATYRF